MSHASVIGKDLNILIAEFAVLIYYMKRKDETVSDTKKAIIRAGSGRLTVTSTQASTASVSVFLAGGNTEKWSRAILYSAYFGNCTNSVYYIETLQLPTCTCSWLGSFLGLSMGLQAWWRWKVWLFMYTVNTEALSLNQVFVSYHIETVSIARHTHIHVQGMYHNKYGHYMSTEPGCIRYSKCFQSPSTAYVPTCMPNLPHHMTCCSRVAQFDI